MKKYVIGLDQSTSNSKAMLFDENGDMAARCDIPHKQIITADGWVEHDPEEIYSNTLAAVKDIISKVDPSDIIGVGICNQRETSVVWDRSTGKPVYNAIVWQCARAKNICERENVRSQSWYIERITGIPLSPYYSAAKYCWILENAEIPQSVCCGTMESWLIWKLTGGTSFKTDYSNASRTQLFDIKRLDWDDGICGIFGVKREMLPELCDSDSLFGMTDFEGLLPSPIPIHAALGDSHASLFGFACFEKGMCKATYGTGSAVMMNIGEAPGESKNGISVSVAWSQDGHVNYIREVNVLYSCAVMKWVVDDVELIPSAKDAAKYAFAASAEDETYLVPAFSGLGAPYYDSHARASFVGMSRTTGKAELIKAAEDCIAYQIYDAISAICSTQKDISVVELRVDGGGSKDKYLVQFQSDILNIPIAVSSVTELSAQGAAYMAGIALGLYLKNDIINNQTHTFYTPKMSPEVREAKLAGWHKALAGVMNGHN